MSDRSIRPCRGLVEPLGRPLLLPREQHSRRHARSSPIANCRRVIEFIERREITHWLIIGGNDSASTALTVSTAAKDAGRDLKVLLVPKTVDNDLVGTDHSPGYGSAARFVAAATQGAGRDAEAMGPAAPITVIEVAGRDSGWLAAASVLGKREQPRCTPCSRYTGDGVRPVASPVGNRKRVSPVRVRRCGHPRECTRPTWTATCRGRQTSSRR